MGTLDRTYKDILKQFFPETSHKIPIYKTMSTTVGKPRGPLTEEHKRHISESLKKKYGATNYDEIFKRFISENYGIIGNVVKKYQPYADRDDLIQEALVKVYENFHRYDPDISKPTTWLNQVVSGHLHGYITPQELKRHGAYVKMVTFKRIAAKFLKDTGKEATNEDISRISGEPLEKVNVILNLSKPVLQLDQPMKFGDDDNMLLGDTLEVIGPSPEDIVERIEAKEMINQAIDQLDDREKVVILENTGYKTGEPKNDSEVARILNISSVYVKKIREKAFDKMKRFLKKKEYVAKSEDTPDKIILYLAGIEQAINQLNDKAVIKSMVTSLLTAISKKEIKKTYNPIRIRQRDPKIFNKDTMRTISLSKSLGIQAVIGELPNDKRTRVQTLIFNRTPDEGKTWDLKEAKSWVKAHKERIKVSLDLKELLEKTKKIIDKQIEEEVK